MLRKRGSEDCPRQIVLVQRKVRPLPTTWSDKLAQALAGSTTSDAFAMLSSQRSYARRHGWSLLGRKAAPTALVLVGNVARQLKVYNGRNVDSDQNVAV